MALITPPFQASVTGLACPVRGSGPVLLLVTAPAPARAQRSMTLTEVPRMPLATTRGFFIGIPRKSTASEASILSFQQVIFDHEVDLSTDLAALVQPVKDLAECQHWMN